MTSDEKEICYPVIERGTRTVDPTKMVVVLDAGGYFIRAFVDRSDKDMISQSDIIEVFRELHDHDLYPEANGRTGLSSQPEQSYLKKPQLLYNNPGKFNSKFSIEREIRALEKIQHPNIVKLLGLHIEDGFVKGLYMSRYDYTLAELLEKKIPFDKMLFMTRLIDTVDYIRSLRYVHGDLHEENIMVLKENTSFPYIVDFDACEEVGTKIIETTKSFGEPGCKYLTYGCDSSAIVDIFKLLFKQEDGTWAIENQLLGAVNSTCSQVH
ncbi:hypothetical protein GGI12_006028 [Dipsacomyces acuminosporus]|nr:hypothetical protein GGI12_006028 [Dipsacomyces acuminosporus]